MYIKSKDYVFTIKQWLRKGIEKQRLRKSNKYIKRGKLNYGTRKNNYESLS